MAREGRIQLAMRDPPIELSRADDRGMLWRVKFDRQEDRFGHELQWLHDGRCVPLLRSHDGLHGDWPTSPPLQQVSLERHADGDVVLGVGMSGRNHWSASFQLDSQSKFTVLVQVACRLNEALGLADPWLRSTYRMANGHGWVLEPLNAPATRAQLENPHGRCSISCTQARLEMQPDSGSLLILAHNDRPLQPLPCTVQWSYRIECEAN